MRWSEFAGKECVDLLQGEKLGSLSMADLSFDQETGQIEQILLPVGSTWFRKKNRDIKFSWPMIRKVGSEMVIIELNSTRK